MRAHQPPSGSSRTPTSTGLRLVAVVAATALVAPLLAAVVVSYPLMAAVAALAAAVTGLARELERLVERRRRAGRSRQVCVVPDRCVDV